MGGYITVQFVKKSFASGSSYRLFTNVSGLDGMFVDELSVSFQGFGGGSVQALEVVSGNVPVSV